VSGTWNEKQCQKPRAKESQGTGGAAGQNLESGSNLQGRARVQIGKFTFDPHGDFGRLGQIRPAMRNANAQAVHVVLIPPAGLVSARFEPSK
jgi:hypothetical protein